MVKISHHWWVTRMKRTAVAQSFRLCDTICARFSNRRMICAMCSSRTPSRCDELLSLHGVPLCWAKKGNPVFCSLCFRPTYAEIKSECQMAQCTVNVFHPRDWIMILSLQGVHQDIKQQDMNQPARPLSMCRITSLEIVTEAAEAFWGEERTALDEPNSWFD